MQSANRTGGARQAGCQPPSCQRSRWRRHITLLWALFAYQIIPHPVASADPPCSCDFSRALGQAISEIPTDGLNSKARGIARQFGCSYANYDNRWYLSLTDNRFTPGIAERLRAQGFPVAEPQFGHPFSKLQMRNGAPYYSCVEPQILLDVYRGNAEPIRVGWTLQVEFPEVGWEGLREPPRYGTNAGTLEIVSQGKTSSLRTCNMPACETCESTLIRLKDARRFINQMGCDGDRLPITGPGRFIPGACGFATGLGTGLVVDYGTKRTLVACGVEEEEAQHFSGAAGFGAGWMAGEATTAYLGGTRFFSMSGCGGLAMSGPGAALATHTHIMTKEICPNTLKACEGMAQSHAQPVTNLVIDRMDLAKNREETEILMELNSYLGLGAIWFGCKYWTGFGPPGGIGGW